MTGRDGTGRTFSAEVAGTAVGGPSGEFAGPVVVLRPAAGVHRPEKGGGAGESTGPVLSALDAQVPQGAAGGESTVQPASRLPLSRQGIEYRVGRMLRRSDAPHRPALVARAHALGVFAAGRWLPRVPPERAQRPGRSPPARAREPAAAGGRRPPHAAEGCHASWNRRRARNSRERTVPTGRDSTSAISSSLSP